MDKAEIPADRIRDELTWIIKQNNANKIVELMKEELVRRRSEQTDKETREMNDPMLRELWHEHQGKFSDFTEFAERQLGSIAIQAN